MAAEGFCSGLPAGYPNPMARAKVGLMGADDDQRGELKRWLRARLMEGERPREEWRRLWQAGWDHLLATPVHDLIDRDAARDLTDRLLDPDLVTELSRPIVAGIARSILSELRAAEEPIDRLLPPEAHDRLRETLARPGLVDPDLLRAMFRGEAVEGVVNDALYRTLKDFSTLLPRMLVKVSPMGRFGMLGGAGAMMEKLIDELEKLIEPEIKSFLADSTGRVLESAADVAIDRLDDPSSIELRINIAGFMLSKSPAFHLKAADEELVVDLGEIVELTARHVAGMPETRANIDTWIDRAMEASAGKSLGQVLQLTEGGARPPIDALADAGWPAFRTLLSSSHAQTWLDTLVDELLDEAERLQS